MELIRVLVVEDYPPFRQFFRAFLSVDPEIVLMGEAGSGPEALLQAAETSPDVAVVDISLPGQGGLETARALMRKWPQTKVLLLLEEESSEYRKACEESGASAHLLKEEASSRLLPLVKAIHRAKPLEEGTGGQTRET